MQAATEYNYLKFTSLEKTVFWDFYTLFNRSAINSPFPIANLSEVINQRKGFVTIDNNKLYKRCRVQIQGKGVVLRDEVIGKEIKTKKQQLCKTDDFLVAEIDAKVGGFGIVPQELENAIVSGHYFLFEINKNLLLREFLSIVVKQEGFLKQVKSTGSTNYAAIRPYHVLDYKIPLPTIVEQNKLVSNYSEKIKEAEILFQQASDLEGDIEKYFFSVLGIDEKKDFELKKGLNFIEYANLSKWSLNHINKDRYDFESAKFKTERLKNLLNFFEGGKTPSKSRSDFWDGNIYWTSPKDFNGQIAIEKAEDKITQLAVNEAGMKVYPKGIILSVFRSGILQHSFPTAITQIETAINQDLKAYSLKEDLIDKKYYLYFVHTFRKYILSLASKKSVTVESINTEDFFEIPIPLPPLNIQNEIALNISNLINKIEKSKLDAVNLKMEAEQEFKTAIFS